MTVLKYILQKLRRTSSGPQVFVSRTHPGLLRRLFEMEVPEILKELLRLNRLHVKQEIVQKFPFLHIMKKSIQLVHVLVQKVHVYKQLSTELNGEKIDIVEWSEDPVVFVANALSPSKVLDVQVNEEEKSTTVVVPDYQLSLAIGKSGQNASLAAKLTGWKIDIKSETDASELGIYPEIKLTS